ncbi:MAG: hypothetical protein FWG42_10595 [Clostridiales bacterium]|nr:hypothetical protein [Clostridiales bacterium]
MLRKQCAQLKKLTGLDSVLCLDNARIYTKDKMLQEGIPFVAVKQQIYMPFLGVALTQNGARDVPYTDKISFITQKVLLTAIYKGWETITLTEAAKAIGMSKMSMTRCFDELQALGLPFVRSETKSRKFIWEGSRRTFWDTVYPFLRNPVARQYRLDKQLEITSAKLGGMSALCHYSMLADEPYTVFAVSKGTVKEFEASKLPLIPNGEAPRMVVQVMQYEIDFGDAVAVDPLSAILSLTDADRLDPRVGTAIEKIWEDCLRD